MFLNAHQRLSVPSALGFVALFSTVEDPATGVPDIIAFQNDGEVDVTLHFDAANNKAEADGATAGTYNVGSTTDQMLVAIDGETAVAITLSHGGTQTAANVCTDINTALTAAGGNTALARAVVRSNKVVILSGTTGQFSVVDIQAPATHSAYGLLGFTVGTNTADSSFSQDIVSNITVKAKGVGTFTNPRKAAKALQIRGQVGDGTTGVNTIIDATTLYRYSGVQQ